MLDANWLLLKYTAMQFLVLMNIGYKCQWFSTYETVFHHTLPQKCLLRHGLCLYYTDESGTIIIIIYTTFVCCPNNKNLINSCSFGKTILTANVEVKILSEIMIWNTHTPHAMRAKPV